MATKKILSLSFVGIFFFTCASSQITLRGSVIDSTSLQPIAFAYLTLSDERTGTSTDIEGNFSLTTPDQYYVLIHISHVGYQSKDVSLSYLKNHPTIALLPTATLLQEVAVTASKEENPAFRIIRQALAHRRDHDPDQLRSYQYISYNKFLVTASAPLKSLDTLAPTRRQYGLFNPGKAQRNFERLDLVLKTSHLFLSESVTEKQKINPDKEKEKLLALQVSGYKSPIFTNVATDYQPFSFYKDNISLLGKDFINPLSHGTFNRYDFVLRDTTYLGQDTVYIIQFKPRHGKLFNALQGMISICTDRFAIKNIIAASADSTMLTTIRIQQNYEKVEGHWFPVQLNTDLDFHEFQVFGKHLMAQHRSFFREIKINPPLQPSSFGDITTELTIPKASENNLILDHYRANELDKKETRTYTFLDSAMHRRAWTDKVIEAVVTQTVPLGLLELDLSRVSRFNLYENFRLGAGLYTSPRFSKWWRFGGYAGYGFRDEQWKYGGEMKFNFNLNKDFFLRFSYAKDIYETGSSHINREGQLLGNESVRIWRSYQYDRIEFYKGEVGYRVLPDVHASLFVSRNEIQPTYDYQLLFYNELINHFSITEAGLTLRYVHGEHYMSLRGRKVFLGQRFPLFTFSVVKAISAFDAQDFNYTRFDFTAKHQVKHRYGGKTNFILLSGWLNGLAPYGKLYNGRGTSATNLMVDGYFQTMGLYEFTTSRYASVFLAHNVGNVLLNKRSSKPELVFYHNMAIGQLDYQGAHSGVVLQDLNKGFLESGLGLNNVLRAKYVNVAYWGLGGAVFYRYGPYQLAQPSSNVFWRLTFSFGF